MVAVLYVLAIFAYIAQTSALKIQPGCSGEEDQDIISDGDAYTFYATFIGASSNNASNPFANVTLILHCRKTSAMCKSRLSYSHPNRYWFKHIVHVDTESCNRTTGDPYACVSQVANGEAAENACISYIHFDALLKPINHARER